MSHIVPRQITDLRQRLAESQKTVLELEAEREQRQRDYDKKLLLAKSKIENVQVRTPGPMGCTTSMFKNGILKCFHASTSGREGVSQLGDHGAEAEDPLPAGPAAAAQQAEGVPGEGDPAPQQGEPGRSQPTSLARVDMFPCFNRLVFVCLQALEEALNLHSPSSSQQPPRQGNFADAANNLKKQELLTQIDVLKEQVRPGGQTLLLPSSSTRILD